MKITVPFILLIVVILSSSVLAITGSIGNARMILRPEVGLLGTTLEKTILVKNVNNETISVKLEASEEFKDMVKIIDSEFLLQQGEEKKARFEIKLKKPGDYGGRIGVFFKEINDTKSQGVALSSTIIIHATKKGLWDSEDEPEEDPEETEENNETTKQELTLIKERIYQTFTS